MPGLRDHEPIVIEEFNGLWKRGDADSTPGDHFSDCDNLQFIESGFRSRDGIAPYRAVANPVRMYNYIMQNGESLLILDSFSNIYHVVDATTVYGPILHVDFMDDFGFVAFNGRAYITPYKSYTDANGVVFQRGIEDEFVYVYKGDGTPARKAAGVAPTNGGLKPFIAFNSSTVGAVTRGIHIIAVAFDGGILGPQVFPVVLAPGDTEIQLINIPLGPGGTASRTIVMTRAIDPKDYVALQSGYTYYTVTTISDNTTVSAKINIADASLTSVYVPGATAAPVSSALTAANTDLDGHCDFGFRLIGVVYETDTGYLTPPGPEFFAAQSCVDVTKSITITNIPVSPNSWITKRHLVATKVIPEYNGDQTGFQFFFIPEGTIENNVDTSLTLNWYDSELLEDASYLIDNYPEIPAGVGLTLYHNRLVTYCDYENWSLVRVSAPGEPEAISQVDGLLIVPLDGMTITNAQEFRDVLYVFKKTRTYAFADNGDVPSSWELNVVDQGIGASVHGIATVLDSGGVNVDFLIIVDFSGIMVFNGYYARPELSFKIRDYWFDLNRNEFNFIQILNDSLSQILYMTLPDGKVLIGNYQNGLDPQSIRWCPWTFDVNMVTLTLMHTNLLLFGAQDPA